jgi:signal transduction histidine kinase
MANVWGGESVGDRGAVRGSEAAEASSRRAVEAERRLVQEATARAAADRANDAKTELLGRLSHDLRTPLNSVLGYAQLLEEADLTDPADRRSVGRILEAGAQIVDLIDEVLELTKVADGAERADYGRAVGSACVPGAAG